MQVNDILFALSIITFILTAITSSIYLLHGGVWLAVASVVVYAGLPVWWTLAAVGITAVVHLVVRFVLLYRESANDGPGYTQGQETLDGTSDAQVSTEPTDRLSRAKMALQALCGPALRLLSPRSEGQTGVQQVSVAREE